ncbi:MAG TPA: DNA-protecting protein DprA, partial [Candidatus Moranbacteria bacterium]|nr:DNA-protecting protein DprA [Candidatus Moranbacteria bacterium]
AGERSGTLITAEKALEYNREVLAVPGDIFSPYSRGANDLIARGAKPVRSAADILEEFASRRAVEADTPLPEMNENERRVFDTLGEQPLPLEKIIPLSRLSAEEALAALSRLEIEGAVLRLEGGFFARK